MHSVVLRRTRTRLGQRRLGVVGLAGFGAGMILFGLSPTPWLAAASLVLAGFAFLGAITSVTTRMQRGIAEDVRGRVMALWGVTFLGSRPIAALVNGATADLVGVRAAVVAAALVALVGAGLLAWYGGSRSSADDRPGAG
jgi:predicted MFS family arabinose efflux permease